MREIEARWGPWLLAGALLLAGCGSRSALEEYFSEDVPAGVGASGGFGAGGSAPASGGSSGGFGLPIDLVHAPDPKLDPPTLCTVDGWCGSNADFVDLSGTSATDIWILARATGVWPGTPAPDTISPLELTVALHWDGVVWQQTLLPLDVLAATRRLDAIWAASPTDVWAVGESGVVVHFDGVSWSSQGAPSLGDWTSVSGSGASDVWIGGTYGRRMHFDGSEWLDADPDGTGDITSLWRTASGLWTVGVDALEFESEGGGSVTDNLGPVSAIWADEGGQAFAVGPAGAVCRWDGAVWTFSNLDMVAPDHFEAVWGHSAADVWAVGRDGALAHFDGSSWTALASGTAKHLHAVWGADGFAWAVGDDGAFLELGRDVPVSSDATREKVHRLWGAAPDDVWAAGAVMIHWDGESWAEVPAQVVGEIFGLSGTSGSDVWAVGSAGTILHWDGSVWSSVPSPTLVNINGVWSRSATEAWAVDEAGRVLRFDGSAWSIEVDIGPEFAPLSAIAGTDAGRVIAVGQERMYSLGGGTWAFSSHPTGDPTYAVAFSDGSDVWFGGSMGKYPELGRFWAGMATTSFTDGVGPDPAAYGLTNDSIVAGWARGPDDVWIALPSVMHWDGATWADSAVGGSDDVVALYGVGQDLWAITAEGNLVRRSLP